MKHVKRYLLLLVMICGLGMFLNRDLFDPLTDRAAEWMEDHHIRAKAAELNKEGFALYYDGDPVDTSSMRMSEKMHLLVSVSDMTEFFGAVVTVGERGNCYVQGQYFEAGAIVSESRTAETIYIDLNEVVTALGMSFRWEDSEKAGFLDTVHSLSLPDSYDLRDHRELNPVKDQGEYGTCWAFAATAALETSVSDGMCWDFSVDHMTMNNGFNVSPAEGGDYNMAIAYLSAWQGPVSEKEDPYGDGVTNVSAIAEKHLQEAVIFTEKDIDYIKSMIIKYGGVESPIHMSIDHAWDASADYQPLNSAYFYSGDQTANHDVVIVGWDDHFSRENFNHVPKNDGAFLCRNSWGEAFGNNGYFYVSYEDSVLGTKGVVYTGIENPDNYSTIYQSDMLGWVGTLGYNAPTAWFANVYTAGQREVLRAVSFYAVDGDSVYDIYVVPEYSGTEDLTQPIYVGSGYCSQGGYYTVDIPEMFYLAENRNFAVMICMTTENSELPIAVEYQASDLTSSVDIRDGQGYVSHDGKSWISAELEYDCNVCLKAFTDWEE